ncbi:MAG: methylated-DNA--[protein]-cysteine S-methyltransferase [Desulfitobacteriaceae bacterium]
MGNRDSSEKLPAEEVLAYWTERVQIGNGLYDLTVATTSHGVCWLSLGLQDKEEGKFAAWAKRWLSGFKLNRDREVNDLVLGEIREYLAGKRKEFSVPLHQVGTPFQVRVWQELLRIPYAATRSYVDVAEKVDCPKGSRAVGLANSKNPIAIIVPCHRVIGKDGGLTGYAGGLDLKRGLLDLEQVVFAEGGMEKSIHRGL